MASGSFRPRKKTFRRKPGQPMVKYFTMDTQDAIVKFQNTDEQAEREKIYINDIMPAFNALVENLINVYGFKVMHDTKEELKMECIEFLYTTLHKFNADKGSKAFSYFNVIAKNWLTIKSKQNVKRMHQYVSLDDRESLTNADIDKIENFSFLESIDEVETQESVRENLQRLVEKIGDRAKSEDEHATVNAIKQVVENLDDLEILSKRAVLLYLREISNLSPRQLSMTLSNIKKYYRDIKKEELS